MSRAVLAAAALACGCAGLPAPDVEVASDGRYVMGTVLEIELAAPGDAEALLGELFALAASLEDRFSRYRPESAVSRLNLAAGQAPGPVPPELARILRDCHAYARLSAGSFDVTVGPLVALWSRAAERDAVPSAAELAEARALVGMDKVRLEPPGHAGLALPGMSVDLGGVAKGWALDRMGERMGAAAAERAFLSFGQSSLLALGAPEGQQGWRVLVRGAGESFAGVALLKDQTLSVSGSFGRSSRIGGRRYGHVLDPRSGEPLGGDRRAVVVAPSAALAEALSKALLVLPVEEGIRVLETQPGVEGLLVEADGALRRSSGWDRAVRFEALPAGG